MKFLYVGCNLFGQITTTKHVAIESLITLHVDNLINLVLGHSVLIIHKENGIYLHGHGLEPRVTHTITKLSFPANENIVDISCSDTRVFFLNDSGGLFVLDFLDRPVEIRKKQNYILREYEFDDRIVKFACGIGINVALSERGKVFNVPNKLEYENENVVYICAGSEHCLLLDKDGNVYSFGRGSRGQLGHGCLEDEAEPKQLEALAGIKITKISSGCWHSCALSQDGDIYTWGWNSDGQLGLFDEETSFKSCDNVEIKENNYCTSETENNLGHEDALNNHSGMCGIPNIVKENTAHTEVPVSVITVPTPVKMDEELNIVNIACGSRHTILLTDDNKLYGCGCNKFNQLGLENRESIYHTSFLHKLNNEDIVTDIKCGPGSTAILLK